MPGLLQKHNDKFTVQPKIAELAYLKLDPSIDLHHVFTLRHYRKLGLATPSCTTESAITLVQPASLRLEAKATVEVRETRTGEILLWHQDQPWELKETQKPQRKPAASKKASSASQRKPAQNHSWKTKYDNTKK
ncbi:hypothetical protein M5W83_12035 [Paenibacillus thiaminolyticus]|uniref:Uncharacterized protein n=1 Tax=Paenibacillus thiaminolyticus TaxID=49283 RepID=A0ABT4FWL2_PANTH|nr:hypothetical protein [Paenibacillus thiaminolyticus]MCY9607875.1 hypothetical protein [Paenibacillus thiaminolyticus]MCY9638024.1 hypothetical protein [Paenibacillus thiaminolyticus]MCY9649904.1 hypothetical protein [Paenibacillus thiaminolyticus]